MIAYKDISPAAQASRGWWRVTLKGDVLDIGYLFSNPLEGWPRKVEKWRNAVDAGAALVPAVTSPAAETVDTPLLYARAVVDVHILGADQGDSVSVVAERLNSLITNVDVTEVALVPNSDPTGRAATFNHATDEASKPNIFARAADLLGKAITLGILAVVIYAGVSLYKASKK